MYSAMLKVSWRAFRSLVYELNLLQSEKLNQPAAVSAAQYGYSAVSSSHGNVGPVDVSFPPFIPLQHQKFINASVELGHPFNPDPYSGNNTGAFWSLSSQNRNAVRTTSEFGYREQRAKQ